MKSQYFSTISNVLLLITTLSISELVSHDDDFKDTECSNTAKQLPINDDVDILNPLYIFK
jgi:hypothetical protein